MNITTEPIRDPKKLNALLSYLRGEDLRNYLMAKVQLNTALRISDTVILQVHDFIHLSGNFREYIVLKEQKTGHERHIAINQALKKDIKEYIAVKKLDYDDYLFKSKKTGGPISTTQAHRIYQDAGIALHLDNFNSHSLRKTWGFTAYQKTKNIALIMQVYGHTSVTQTLKYIGITQTDKDTLYNTIKF